MHSVNFGIIFKHHIKCMFTFAKRLKPQGKKGKEICLSIPKFLSIDTERRRGRPLCSEKKGKRYNRCGKHKTYRGDYVGRVCRGSSKLYNCGLLLEWLSYSVLN